MLLFQVNVHSVNVDKLSQCLHDSGTLSTRIVDSERALLNLRQRRLRTLSATYAIGIITTSTLLLCFLLDVKGKVMLLFEIGHMPGRSQTYCITRLVYASFKELGYIYEV